MIVLYEAILLCEIDLLLLLFTELMLFNEEANEVIVYVLAWIIVINYTKYITLNMTIKHEY